MKALCDIIDIFRTLSPRKKFRLRYRAGAILFAGIATYALSVLTEEGKYSWATIPVAALIITSLIEFIVADIVTDKRYPKNTDYILQRLEEKLSSCDHEINELIKKLIDTFSIEDKGVISGTFHLKIDLYDDIMRENIQVSLVQIIKYTGKLGGEKWRFAPATKGIIGKCLRTKDIQFENFADDNEFKIKMVADYGYTENEIYNRTQTARSYYTYPAIDGSNVIGVLYLFSTQTNTFPGVIGDNSMTKNTVNNIISFLKGAEII